MSSPIRWCDCRTTSRSTRSGRERCTARRKPAGGRWPRPAGRTSRNTGRKRPAEKSRWWSWNPSTPENNGLPRSGSAHEAAGMTQPVISPLHEDLIFHGPLSDGRAAQLIRSLGALDGQHVVDLGCGWAELLLRTVAAEPGATGHGVDRDAIAIEHGRANEIGR